MIRRYQRFLAVTLSAVMTVLPATALAAGGTPETDLTHAVAKAIVAQEDTAFEESILAGTLELPLPEEEDVAQASAEEPEPVILPEEGVYLMLNGEELVLENYARRIADNSYVPVRDFFTAMGCTVTWDSANGKIRITRGEELEGELIPGSRLAKFNGRCWYMAEACVNLEYMNMIPLRDAAKVFNCAVTWEEATRTAYLEGYGLLEPGGTFYDQADLLWIARIVRHESGNQILDGKVAVANVILNRMGNPGFPNTAEEVIFDTRTGVQFVTRESTKIYIEPSEECFLAAKLAMEGYETAPDCLYFASNRVAKRCWAGRNRPMYGVIGGHTFFK